MIRNRNSVHKVFKMERIWNRTLERAGNDSQP